MPEETLQIEMIVVDKSFETETEYFLRISQDGKAIFWVTRDGEIGWTGDKEKELRHAWLIGCVAMGLMNVDDYKRFMNNSEPIRLLSSSVEAHVVSRHGFFRGTHLG